MAVDYDKLFAILGKHVKHVNLMYAHVAEIGTHQTQLATVLSEAGMAEMVDDLPDLMQGAQDNITQWIIGDSKSLSDRLLLDPTLVVDELVLSAPPTVRAVLEKLYIAMEDGSELLNGGGTPNMASIVSDDEQRLQVMYGSYLDGNTPPAPDIPQFTRWVNAVSKLGGTVDFVATCIGDYQSSNVVRGSETFLLEGGPNNGFYSRKMEGAGQLQVSACNNQSVFPLGKFDSYTDSSSNPPGFTNVSGTPGADFSPNSAGLRGTRCLAGVLGGACELRANISPNLLTRRRTFFLWFAAKLDSTAGDGSITVSLCDGSGTITSGLDTATVNCSYSDLFETDWTIFYQAFQMPESLNGQTYIKLEIADFDVDVLIDDISLTPANYFNGMPINVAVVDDEPILGDKITAQMSVASSSYIFLDYLRKQYRFQLPYGTATISDTLAQ